MPGLSTEYWAACCVKPAEFFGLDDYRCSGCSRQLSPFELYLWESSARKAHRDGG